MKSKNFAMLNLQTPNPFVRGFYQPDKVIEQYLLAQDYSLAFSWQ